MIVFRVSLIILFASMIFADMKFLTVLAFRVKKEDLVDANFLCLWIAICSTVALISASSIVQAIPGVR
jgi:hypothetical protein